jgi:hypothetical protein
MTTVGCFLRQEFIGLHDQPFTISLEIGAVPRA